MRLIIVPLVLMLFGGCAYTVFAPPKMLYSTQETIGVKYRSRGAMSHDEPGKAMKLIAEHCGGRYEVTSRAENNGWTTVDAKCSK